MQLIENKIINKDYLSIDIINNDYDDILKPEIELNIVFNAELSNLGVILDVYEIKNIKWSYIAIFNNVEQTLTGMSDNTWDINYNINQYDNKKAGLFFQDIIIDIKNKKINIGFEY